MNDAPSKLPAPGICAGNHSRDDRPNAATSQATRSPWTRVVSAKAAQTAARRSSSKASQSGTCSTNASFRTAPS